MKQALKQHWPEYLMEAAELGIFMISACVFAVILWHPASPVPPLVASPFLRFVLSGLAMGLTAVCIIYSPWGQRSGAHFNPSITLTFFRLRKIAPWDAFFYIVAQFIGGVAGVLVAALFLGDLISHPAVNYAVTIPGPHGARVAFITEFLIAFVLMLVVLVVSNHLRLAHYTPLFVATLVAVYISFEAPISGMSMNPARSFGSALPGNIWTALWVYFSAPPLGMLLAGETYVRLRGLHAVYCAKLNHHGQSRCIFHCRFAELAGTGHGH